MEILSAEVNRFNGVVVETGSLPSEAEAFETKLLASLAFWRTQGRKVVWLPIDAPRACLIPVALAHGFEFHHAQGLETMMVQRLIDGAFLPHYATHTIGGGGVVINAHNEILTIVELAHMKDRPNLWKLPGGMIDPGEHIETGIVREVLEETGIEARFDRLLTFRHYHGEQFRTSNIYAIGLLTPLTHEICIQEDEIGKACWMPVAQFMNTETACTYSRYILREVIQRRGWYSINLEGFHISNHDEYEIYS